MVKSTHFGASAVFDCPGAACSVLGILELTAVLRKKQKSRCVWKPNIGTNTATKIPSSDCCVRVRVRVCVFDLHSDLSSPMTQT